LADDKRRRVLYAQELMAIAPGKRERENLWRLLEMAREEDLGSGDVTSAMLPSEVTAIAVFRARQPMIVCGVALLESIAAGYDGQIRTTCVVGDGQAVDKDAVLARWTGPAKGIMAAERVALNFIQRLSGVATTTNEYVKAVAGTGAAIYDTRKTMPGWRDLEKYAVRAGGGKNHRHGLYDAVLIKDNHLAILAKAQGQDPIKAAADELEQIRPFLGDRAFIELEVDTLDQFMLALALPVDIILLDNMSIEQLELAVNMRNNAGLAGKLELEASGGITLSTVRSVARTGVERISVGALTHSAAAVDIALDIDVD
jgi:nicotinate-nucleotide pyrophosphorylase (carboxylating)